VFAAASLREAMDDQARLFEASTGNKVIVAYAASSALARQIEAGAPADVFISADVGWMDYVDARGLVVAGTRVDLLRNALVLVAPQASTIRLTAEPGFALADALAGGRLAMANPDSVPAGKYGRRALESLGVWASVAPRVARAENVRAALFLVSRGEAPLGIVYRTDALADPGVRVVATFPERSHPPIVYPAALMRNSRSAAAAALLAAMQTPQARAAWRRRGFETAP
jgi:molybdate transport system substrate-binding protein